ncbi:MAG: hypothetical protein JWQ98_3051 [Chlorobi bacterium]|nr:hypothetical protein [Chlorobiota bacterium]
MKRTLAISLTLLALFCCAGTLRAQGSTPIAVADTGMNGQDFYRNPSYGIGLMAGLTSGAGLSGRATFPGGFAAQATAFVITVGNWTHFNLGGEVQYAFIRKNTWRLYGLFGMGFYSSHTSDTAFPGNRISDPFRFGIGPGYESFIGDQLVFSVALPITVFPNTGKVYPVPEAGFFFYFR